MNEKGLEELTTWKKALAFSVWICKEILPLLPKDETYSLINQLRRSVQSIPANIAEGYGRFYYQENIRFCYIARGSLKETFSHVTFAKEMGYISEDVNQHAQRELEELWRLINGYIAYLKKSKPGLMEPGSSIREVAGDYLVESSEDDQSEESLS